MPDVMGFLRRICRTTAIYFQASRRDKEAPESRGLFKQSPDGDVVECIISHLQPAFDHPLLKGQKPLEPLGRPKHNESIDFSTEVIQAWMNTSESCLEGTIPIRKTTEQDVLRASLVRRFGRKIRRIDTTSNDHEVDSLLSFKI
ncbi:hypothetical protein AgCh_027462 [Apium graveolens]